jgi:hypothetical protein
MPRIPSIRVPFTLAAAASATPRRRAAAPHATRRDSSGSAHVSGTRRRVTRFVTLLATAAIGAAGITTAPAAADEIENRNRVFELKNA